MSANNTQDTIAAIATPPGRGGVGIIRVSGKLAETIAQKIVKKSLSVREATYLPFFDEQDTVLDEGIAIYFKAPNSFTGEDVLELQGHGGPVILDLLLQEILKLGVRLARPGEFSERAFLLLLSIFNHKFKILICSSYISLVLYVSLILSKALEFSGLISSKRSK